MADAVHDRCLSVILLAAGQSSRMRTFKPLLPFGTSSLYGFQLQQLAEIGAEETIVVLGANADQLRSRTPSQVSAVFNPDHPTGRASSIRAGVTQAKSNRDVLIISVDQPRPAWFLRRLIDRHFDGEHLVSLPTYRGRNGHPTVFSHTLRDELLAVEERSQGLKAVVRRHATEINRVDIDSEWAVVNLNRPEDYEQALAIELEEQVRRESTG